MDRKKWPRTLLVKMYRVRWGIETAFRELKIHDRIENFTAKNTNGICQEIAVYMIARLLAGMLIRYVIHEYKIDDRWDNETQSVCNHVVVAETVADLCIAYIRSNQNEITKILIDGIKDIKDTMQKRRPDRSYEITCKGRYGRWKGTKNCRKNYV